MSQRKISPLLIATSSSDKLTPKQIATKLGCSLASVYRLRDEPVKPTHSDVLSLRECGFTLRDIALLTGLSHTTIWRWTK